MSKAPSLSEAKALCVSDRCPKCGSHDVNVEQVISGDVVVTSCHCRKCNYSWHRQKAAS